MPMVTGRISGKDGGGMPPSGKTFYVALYQSTTKKYGPVTLDAEGDYVFPSVLNGTYTLKIKESTDADYIPMDPPRNVTVSGVPVVANATTSKWTKVGGALLAGKWHYCSNVAALAEDSLPALREYVQKKLKAASFKWYLYPGLLTNVPKAATPGFPIESLVVFSKNGDEPPAVDGLSLKWNVCKATAKPKKAAPKKAAPKKK